VWAGPGKRLGSAQAKSCCRPRATTQRAPVLQEAGARRGKDSDVRRGVEPASHHHSPVPQIKKEGGVSFMAKAKGKGSDGGTGPAAASSAGRVLRNPKSSKDDKKAAASDLAQTPPRKKGK
jgi:hypothetical protein